MMIRNITTLLLCLAVNIGQAMTVKEKHIYGYVEKVSIPALKTTVKAKLDTGAKSSSLSAVNIQEQKENGKTFLTFTIPLKSGSVKLKKELVGEVKIKTRASERIKGKIKALHRPIVKMNVQLGSQSREIEVNLTNRKRFNYPLLLGRDALIEFGCIVDPAESFLADSKEKK